ncbi:MAG TPA: DUF1292 domain-containing protein [Clostridia bacterium]|nr:DUF1292 domain-containing protein [Clostridia bacterium]
MTETHDNIIELVDEEGNVFSFTLIEAFEVEGKRYAVLIPNDEDTGEALVLKIEVDENGEECLYEITDDEEWDTVMQVWEALMDE